jgi:hypothetical protein
MPTCPDGHESASSDFCDTCGIRIEGQPAASTTAGGAAMPGAVVTGATASGPTCPHCGADKTGMFCEVCGYDYASGRPNVSVAAPLGSPTAPAASATPAAPAAPAQPTQPGLGAAYVGTASATNVVGAAGATSAVAEQAASPAAATAAGWTAIVTADRAYFDSVIAASGPDAASIEFPIYCPERRFTLSGQEMRIGRRSTSRGLEPEIDLTGPPTDPGISHLHAVLVAQPDGTWSVLDPGSSNGTQVNGTDVASGVPVPLHPGDRVSLGAWTVLTIQAN